ncbi:TOBE domain-containing protein, partial [Rhizobiaceae sp. 2RAB30]
QNAKPAVTYRQPSNAFVANFIGVTNFIPGIVDAVDGNAVAMTSRAVKISGVIGDERAPPTEGREASGAIRAEQIRIAGDESRLAGLATVLSGEVADAIFEGERVVYEIAVPALGGDVLRVFDHDPAGHTQYEVGARVFIGWNARDVFVFNK